MLEAAAARSSSNTTPMARRAIVQQQQQQQSSKHSNKQLQIVLMTMIRRNKGRVKPAMLVEGRNVNVKGAFDGLQSVKSVNRLLT